LSNKERRIIAETFASETNASFFYLSTSEFINDEKIICINKIKGSSIEFNKKSFSERLFYAVQLSFI
jgi:hypothetical protein